MIQACLVDAVWSAGHVPLASCPQAEAFGAVSRYDEEGACISWRQMIGLEVIAARWIRVYLYDLICCDF